MGYGGRLVRDVGLGVAALLLSASTVYGAVTMFVQRFYLSVGIAAAGVGLVLYYSRRAAGVDEPVWELFGTELRALAARAGVLDPPVELEGAVLDDRGEVWACRRYRGGTTEVTGRLCPSCRLGLVERHRPVDRTEGTPVADGGVATAERPTDTERRTRNALVCPHCAFTTTGEKDVRRGADVARARFDGVVDRMHESGTRGLGAWRRTARERLGRPPTPAEVWDEYYAVTDGANDDTIHRRTVGELGTPDDRSSDTYRAFAELRRERELNDRLVDALPAGLDSLVARGVRSDYLVEKRTLQRDREAARSAFEPVHRRLRENHAPMLSALTRARANRTWPPQYPDERFAAAEADLERLADVREEYDALLLGAEHETVDRLGRQIDRAGAYRSLTDRLRERLDAVEESMAAFEAPFEPYATYDRYLTTAERDRLDERLGAVAGRVTEAVTVRTAATLDPPAGVDDRLDDARATLHGWARALHTYESSFLDHERERFPGVFTTEHGPLNERQALAVVRDERFNLVDASAGTGKTLTLTQRFRYCYERGTERDDIVAITFGNEAAREMGERIGESLGCSPRDLNVSTMNRLAMDIVGRAVDCELDGERLAGGQAAFLRDAFAGSEEFGRVAPEAMDRFESWLAETTRSDVAEVFDAARNFDRGPDEIRERTDEGNLTEYRAAQAVAALLEVYRAVGEAREHPIDHGHCVERATELLERYRDRYADRYEHVLVDEFQDVSPRNLTFIRGLLGPETHLFAVGDDWQCIYAFRGSDPRYFRSFDEVFGGAGEAARTTLAVNYRCAPCIVDTSVELMAASDEATSKHVQAFEGAPDGEIELHRLTGAYTERGEHYTASLVAETYERLVAETPPGETVDPMSVLVLNRSKSARDAVRERLVERGLPAGTGGNHPIAVETLHKTKGKEAACVFIPYVDDDTYRGVPRCDLSKDVQRPVLPTDGDRFEEERRLLYVGMTRAKRGLTLVGHGEGLSRFLTDEVLSRVTTVDDHVEGVEGVLERVERNSDGFPSKAVVDCGPYRAYLASWEHERFDALREGERYRFADLAFGGLDYDESVEVTGESRVEQLP